MKYTKDFLTEIIIDSNKQMVAAMTQIGGALKQINDNNVLHCTALEENTKTSQNLVIATESTFKLFKWVLISLVLAIIMLAGAEKVIQFIPIL